MRLAAGIAAAAATVIIIAEKKNNDDNNYEPCVVTEEVHCSASFRSVQNILTLTSSYYEKGRGMVNNSLTFDIK